MIAKQYSSRLKWFNLPMRQFSRTVLPLAGQPVSYLEVGTFEGQSACWMLDNVLTHPGARCVCVDPWEGPYGRRIDLKAVEAKARANLDSYGDKVQIIKGFSPEAVEPLENGSFDVAYIDGHHTREAVRKDSFAVWPKLRLGGILLWDDWQNQVEDGVDDFLKTVYGCYQVLSQQIQLHVRKIAEKPRE